MLQKTRSIILLSECAIFFNFLFCIWVYPIYNVVIISGEQRKVSAIHIPVSTECPNFTLCVKLWFLMSKSQQRYQI